MDRSLGPGSHQVATVPPPEIDAVLCGSEQIARGVLDALREVGCDVPGDIAVMGHDNWEQIATQSRPPLSTIDMNLEAVGRLAAQLFSPPSTGSESRERTKCPAAW